jgi:hypothetical protein
MQPSGLNKSHWSLCDLGIAADGDTEDSVLIVKQVGKVAALRKLIDEQKVDFGKTFISHCSMVSKAFLHTG